MNIYGDFDFVPDRWIQPKHEKKWLFFTRTYQASIEVYNFKGTAKTLSLFEKKPSQSRFSKWLWGVNHVAVPIKGRTEPLFISVSQLSSATGVKRAVLREVNPAALAQLIHANHTYRSANDNVRKLIAVVNKQKNLDIVEGYNQLNSLLNPMRYYNLSQLMFGEDVEVLKEVKGQKVQGVEGNIFLLQKISESSSLKQLIRKISHNLEDKVLAKIIDNETLLNAFVKLPADIQSNLLRILKNEKDFRVMEELHRLTNGVKTANQTVVPWKGILGIPEFLAFFKEINAIQFKSESYDYILNHEEAQTFMKGQTNQQNERFIQQLEQDPSFTKHFLTKLTEWSKNGASTLFEVELSKEAAFDQKLKQLAALLQQEGISAETGSQALFSFLCNPEMDLTVLFSLLKIEKTAKTKVNMNDFFHVLNASSPVRAAVMDPSFLKLLENEKINANMLLHALKKVDDHWKAGACYKKKKKDKRYGFEIDRNKHFFIRTYAMGRGTFKKAAKAVSDLSNVIVLSFKKPKCNPYANPPQEELKTEERILNLKLQNVMPPFIATRVGYEKCLAVQQEMTGDGEKLIKGPPRQILYALTDVVKGLIALHGTRRFHSDFKPGNFLFKGDLTSQTTPVVGYLHDFGLVARIGDYQTSGSPAYIPPEREGSAKSDAFALGVSLVYLLLGIYSFDERTVFSSLSQARLDQFIQQQFNNFDDSSFSTEEKNIRSDLIDLTKQLLKLRVDERLSCVEALNKLEALKKKYPFPVAAAITV